MVPNKLPRSLNIANTNFFQNSLNSLFVKEAATRITMVSPGSPTHLLLDIHVNCQLENLTGPFHMKQISSRYLFSKFLCMLDLLSSVLVMLMLGLVLRRREVLSRGCLIMQVSNDADMITRRSIEAASQLDGWNVRRR